MGLDELKQALVEQRTNGAEKDWLEMVSRVLEVPLPLLHRVLYALEVLGHYARGKHDWDALLPNEELREGIRMAMNEGLFRVTVANGIRNGWSMPLPAALLVPEGDKVQICRGCPERLECVTDQLYTPDECFTTRKKLLPVVPVRMSGTHVEVDAKQPQGRHTIALSSIP